MPSDAHQWLVVWTARRMQRDGFVVTGFDGQAPRDTYLSDLPSPFHVNGVRADVWGQRPGGPLIAFGEAKTLVDIDTAHTRTQVLALSRISMKCRGRRCPLYIAIPRSGAYALDQVLNDVGLFSAPQIIRLHIPDILLQDTPNGSRKDHRITA